MSAVVALDGRCGRMVARDGDGGPSSPWRAVQTAIRAPKGAAWCLVEPEAARFVKNEDMFVLGND